MTEGTKQFLLQNLQWVIRFLVVVTVLAGVFRFLYIEFSPYQDCLRKYSNQAGFSCLSETSW